MKVLNLVLAATGGALVGAAAALLLAPKSGAETREDIRRFVRKSCPCLKDKKINELAERIQAEIAEVK